MQTTADRVNNIASRTIWVNNEMSELQKYLAEDPSLLRKITRVIATHVRCYENQIYDTHEMDAYCEVVVHILLSRSYDSESSKQLVTSLGSPKSPVPSSHVEKYLDRLYPELVHIFSPLFRNNRFQTTEEHVLFRWSSRLVQMFYNKQVAYAGVENAYSLLCSNNSRTWQDRVAFGTFLHSTGCEPNWYTDFVFEMLADRSEFALVDCAITLVTAKPHLFVPYAERCTSALISLLDNRNFAVIERDVLSCLTIFVTSCTHQDVMDIVFRNISSTDSAIRDDYKGGINTIFGILVHNSKNLSFKRAVSNFALQAIETEVLTNNNLLVAIMDSYMPYVDTNRYKKLILDLQGRDLAEYGYFIGMGIQIYGWTVSCFPTGQEQAIVKILENVDYYEDICAALSFITRSKSSRSLILTHLRAIMDIVREHLEVDVSVNAAQLLIELILAFPSEMELCVQEILRCTEESEVGPVLVLILVMSDTYDNAQMNQKRNDYFRFILRMGMSELDMIYVEYGITALCNIAKRDPHALIQQDQNMLVQFIRHYLCDAQLTEDNMRTMGTTLNNMRELGIHFNDFEDALILKLIGIGKLNIWRGLRRCKLFFDVTFN